MILPEGGTPEFVMRAATAATVEAEKHGCFMKIIRKFRDEELLYDADGVWKPTVKLNDLMPYYLSQTRITEIHSILEGGKPDASDP